MVYKLKVYRYGGTIDSYTTKDIEDLRRYYSENWKWYEGQGDCYCAVLKNGKKLSISETIKTLAKDYE